MEGRFGLGLIETWDVLKHPYYGGKGQPPMINRNMGCIETNQNWNQNQNWNRLIETWDVLKQSKWAILFYPIK